MKPYRILVIDDEAVICEGCRMVLSEEGYEVATCFSGKQGLQMAIDGEFDLVLLDMKLVDSV